MSSGKSSRFRQVLALVVVLSLSTCVEDIAAAEVFKEDPEML